VYDLAAYGVMMADHGRVSAYARALEARVTPSSIVLDIGTGPGILALLACRAGASRVYAVEADDVIQLAREAAHANGFADRTTFLRGMSTDVNLPERVDGIVTALQGVLPLFGKSLVSILDARRRFLKPGGWIMPERESLWATLVSSAADYERLIDTWTTEYRFDLSAARTSAVNQWRRTRLDECDVLVAPRCWAVLDYGNLESPNVRGEMTWTIEHAAMSHGIGVWFDAETAPGIGWSNSPLTYERHVFRQAFFPWPAPIELSPGDEVHVRLRADFMGEDYAWGWETSVTDGASACAKVAYRQSSWLAAPVTTERLRKRGDTFVPDLSDDARIDRRILELMERRLPLREIATEIHAAFPDLLENWDAALTRAGMLSERYSK